MLAEDIVAKYNQKHGAAVDMKHNSGTRTPSLLVILIYVSDLERVQKSACKLILKEKYISYVDELRKLNI